MVQVGGGAEECIVSMGTPHSHRKPNMCARVRVRAHELRQSDARQQRERGSVLAADSVEAARAVVLVVPEPHGHARNRFQKSGRRRWMISPAQNSRFAQFGWILHRNWT